jgi:hypothetical protein
MSLPIYSTGTVSVAAGGTTVTGAGVMWSGINVKQGDFISIAGLAEVLITEVTDAANLKIAPWQGAAQTNAPYLIYQNYVGRVVGVAAAEDVGEMLEKLHVDGLPFIVGAEETVPDPSYGDEGQLAFKPSTGQWWVKQGGVWVPSAGLTALGYGGTSATPMLIGISPPTKVFTTQTSLAYNGARVRAASAANLNNWMEGVATYSGTTLTMAVDLVGNSGTYSDWLFSIAGTKGAVGATGATGPQGVPGPPGATGSGAGNVTGPASSVNDRIAVYNGPSGTVIKDGGKTIAELGAGTIIVSDTRPDPATTQTSALWWDSTEGNLYILYDDLVGTPSKQWVLAVPATSAASIGAVAYTPQTASVAEKTVARQNIYAAPFDAVAYSGMQINGSMEVSQENGTTPITINNKYVCDGWVAAWNGTMTMVAFQSDAAPTLFPGLPKFLNIFTQTAQPTLLAADYVIVSQPIEGYRIARLAWGTANAKPITLGFWTCHVRAGTYGGSIRNGSPDRSYAFNYTQNVGGIAEYKTITIPGCTDGTWSNGNTTGLSVIFAMACGANFTAPSANTWLVGNYVTAPGQINNVAAVNDTCRWTGVVVLPGIEAPSAERSALIMRPYDQELVTCQRYYRIIVPEGAGIPSATDAIFTIRHSGMRAAPSIQALEPITITNTAAFFTQSSANATVWGTSKPDSGTYKFGNFSGLPGPPLQSALIFSMVSTTNRVQFDARL